MTYKLLSRPEASPPPRTRAASKGPGPVHSQRSLALGGERSTDEADADAFAARVARGQRPTPPPARATSAEHRPVDPQLAQDIHAARATPGERLPGDVRARLVPAIQGRDLALHTDHAADRLVRRLDANAFAVGHDLFFRSGAFRPGTPTGLHTLAHEVAHTLQVREAGGGELVRLARRKRPEPLPEVTVAWMSRMLADSLGLSAPDTATMAEDLMRDMYNSASKGAVAMTPDDFKKTHPITVNGEETHQAYTSTRVFRPKRAQALAVTASGTRRRDVKKVTGSLLTHEQIHKDIAVFVVLQFNNLIVEISADLQRPLDDAEMQVLIDAAGAFTKRWSDFYDADRSVFANNRPANIQVTGHDPDSAAQTEYWNTGQWYVDAMADWLPRRAEIRKQLPSRVP